MRVWFTADLHFGHGNIIRYCQRPFLSTAEQELLRTHGARGKWCVSDATIRRHDEMILEALNERIEPGDLLWIVGDFCWGGLVEATRYRELIRCHNVYLVWGNHDQRGIAPVFTETL